METNQIVTNQTPSSPITQSATTPPIPPTHMQLAHANKSPLPLIILVVVLATVAGYFAFQNYQLKQQLASREPLPTPQPNLSSASPVAEWKTYTNLKYNYEIKQPQEALVGYFDVRSGLFNDGKGDEDQLDILLTSQAELFKKFIQIEVSDAAAYKKTLSAAVNDIYSQQKEHFQTTKISELKPIKYLGFDGYEYTFSGQAMIALNWGGVVEEGEYKVRIFEKDKYYFSFYSRADQVFDQILSTFKFTK